MPISISEALKSTDRTVERHMMANWKNKKQKCINRIQAFKKCNSVLH
jgi:hypothetical protein